MNDGKKSLLFSNSKRWIANQEKIDKTNQNIYKLNKKNVKDLTMLSCKPDTTLLEDVPLKYKNGCIQPYDLDHFFCVLLTWNTYECCLFENKQCVEYVRNEQLYVSFETGLRGRASGADAP